MFERPDRLWRIAGSALAALILFQFVRLAVTRSPLHQVRIPALPAFSASPDAQPGRKETNAVAQPNTGKKITNVVPAVPASPATPVAQTGSKGTNVVARPNPLKKETNVVVRPVVARPDTAKKETSVPPAVQAHVDRITQSEILGPVIRPLPMALLGIAGKDAILRAPNGQTGLLQEGGELGGVKLLRIGTNRVLIELDGQTNELTVFSGFGGETLLLKGKETPQ